MLSGGMLAVKKAVLMSTNDHVVLGPQNVDSIHLIQVVGRRLLRLFPIPQITNLDLYLKAGPSGPGSFS
eukprot:5332067-Amphidinium_carterae.1